MTPYEIMLSESQERMLLVVKQGREARGRARSSRSGICTPSHIGDGHRRRPAAGEGSRRRRRRDPEHARSPTRRRSTTGRRRGPPTSTRRSALDSRALRAGAARRRRPAHAARLADHRQQALGLPAVRPHGAHQHARARRRWAPASCASRAPTRALAMSVDGNGRYCYLDPATRRACWRWPRPRATSPAPARVPIGATNCLNFGNPERPEIMWQFVEAVEGIGRRLPRARHADHRRQRQSLQRDRRPARSIRRRSSASSGSSRTPTRVVRARIQGSRRRRRPARRELRRARRQRVPEGGPRHGAGRAAGARSGPRAGADPSCSTRAAARRPAAVGARLFRRRPRGHARRVRFRHRRHGADVELPSNTEPGARPRSRRSFSTLRLRFA